MKCLTDEEIAELSADARAEMLRVTAQALVDLAAELGLVLTIEQVSVPPLAMGNYVTTVAVRPARIKA